VTVLAALLSLLSSAAFAETAWDVIGRFGWTGSWSLSCSELPSPTNAWLKFYRDANGVARRSLDRGNGPELTIVIDSAQIITATTMAARLRNDDSSWGTNNGVYVDAILVKENGRIRAISSKKADGTEVIKDGIIISSGKPSPWTEKCGE